MNILKIILFLFLIISSFPQTEEYIFKQFTDADGLSQSTIFSMLQDKEGYLWLGTIDGLNRYDGYEFRVYVNNPNDTTSISDNFISTLFEDSEGNIWIGTVNGYFNCFNRKTEIFKRFYVNNFFSVTKNQDTNFYEYPLAFSRNQINTVTCITEDNEGFLWIGTWGNGIIKFDRKNGTSEHFFYDKNNPSGISSNRILDILLDSDGEIWVATFGGGLNKLIRYESPEESKSKFHKYTFLKYTSDNSNKFSLSDNKTISLFEDKNKNIWIGTFYGGLNKLDVVNKRLTQDKIRFKRYSQENSTISNNTIMAIQQDLDGFIWLGTFGGGICRMDTRNEKFINFSKISSPQNGLNDKEILSLFVDRSGILWAGSHLGEGVTKIQKIKLKFDVINSKSMGNLKLNDDVVWSLFKDNEGNLWVGTYRGGVDVLNFRSNHRKIYSKSSSNENAISDNHIRSIAKDKLGNMWIGTYSGGLNRIDGKNKKISVYKNEPGIRNSISANQVLDIYVESEKRICP